LQRFDGLVIAEIRPARRRETHQLTGDIEPVGRVVCVEDALDLHRLWIAPRASPIPDELLQAHDDRVVFAPGEDRAPVSLLCVARKKVRYVPELLPRFWYRQF